MKNITFLLLILLTTLSYGQDCKYKRNEVDQFTKNKVLETKSEWLGENIAYTLKKIDDTKYLRIELGSYSVFAINDGAKLMFLTDKDESIELIFPKYEISKTTPGAVASQYVVETINISGDVLKRLQTEKIIKVRFYTTEGYIDKPIKEKRASKFRDQLKCIE